MVLTSMKNFALSKVLFTNEALRSVMPERGSQESKFETSHGEITIDFQHQNDYNCFCCEN